MTHFLPAIKALKDSKPKNAEDRKARRRALSILYGAERKEEKGKKRTRTRKSKSRETEYAKKGAIGFARFIHKSYKGYKERKREERFAKARTVKKIRESNLSPEQKRFEVSQITHVPQKETNLDKAQKEFEQKGHYTTNTKNEFGTGKHDNVKLIHNHSPYEGHGKDG